MRRTAIAAAMALSLALAGAAGALAPAPDMMGRHAMQGQITSLDARTGWIHLKTHEGTMIMHFPPAALEGLKKGDTITVHLALKDEGPGPK